MAVGTMAFLDLYSFLLDPQLGVTSDLVAHSDLILQHGSQPRGGKDGGSDSQESEKEVELI
jgi:hypothetical protein